MGLSIRDPTADHCGYFLKGILSFLVLLSFCRICVTLNFLPILLIHLVHLYSWGRSEEKQITISFGTLQVHGLNLTFDRFLASSLKVSQSSSLCKASKSASTCPTSAPTQPKAFSCTLSGFAVCLGPGHRDLVKALQVTLMCSHR